jgi:hypothetical protein
MYISRTLSRSCCINLVTDIFHFYLTVRKQYVNQIMSYVNQTQPWKQRLQFHFQTPKKLGPNLNDLEMFCKNPAGSMYTCIWLLNAPHSWFNLKESGFKEWRESSQNITIYSQGLSSCAPGHCSLHIVLLPLTSTNNRCMRLIRCQNSKWFTII